MERTTTGLGIALQFEYDEIKDKGWFGQPKGLLRVLWEPGWIDKKQKVRPLRKHNTKHKFAVNTAKVACKYLIKLIITIEDNWWLF